MSNATLNNFLDLPATLKRKLIFHANGLSFGIGWMDRLIRYFSSESSAQSVTYPVDIYIESVRYSGELEVRRDGTHAIRMLHGEMAA